MSGGVHLAHQQMQSTVVERNIGSTRMWNSMVRQECVHSFLSADDVEITNEGGVPNPNHGTTFRGDARCRQFWS